MIKMCNNRIRQYPTNISIVININLSISNTYKENIHHAENARHIASVLFSRLFAYSTTSIRVLSRFVAIIRLACELAVLKHFSAMYYESLRYSQMTFPIN